MKKAVIYVHGKGGNAGEALHYAPLFPDFDVIGFDYSADTPWEAKSEFTRFFDSVRQNHSAVVLIANSIGAYFAMSALDGTAAEKAYFISPVVDMERLILDMMRLAGVSERELFERQTVETAFGETLSWEYLRFVRENPVRWRVPTHILCGGADALVPFDSVSAFASGIGATLDVMSGGEHWFHTPEQMAFLDAWIRKYEQEDLGES